MSETAYYANDLSTNAHTDIDSNDNKHKILEGKQPLAIPVRALRCIRIPVQNKCANGEKTPDPIARINTVFGSQFVNLFVPFFNAENEIFIFCQPAKWKRKWAPDNARTETKMIKTGHFGKLRIWGLWKMRIWGSQCADKSCAHTVYNIYKVIKHLPMQ